MIKPSGDSVDGAACFPTGTTIVQLQMKPLVGDGRGGSDSAELFVSVPVIGGDVVIDKHQMVLFVRPRLWMQCDPSSTHSVTCFVVQRIDTNSSFDCTREQVGTVAQELQRGLRLGETDAVAMAGYIFARLGSAVPAKTMASRQHRRWVVLWHDGSVEGAMRLARVAKGWHLGLGYTPLVLIRDSLPSCTNPVACAVVSDAVSHLRQQLFNLGAMVVPLPADHIDPSALAAALHTSSTMSTSIL